LGKQQLGGETGIPYPVFLQGQKRDEILDHHRSRPQRYHRIAAGGLLAMKTLDLLRLTQTLRLAEPNQSGGGLDQLDLNPYLLENVVVPFLRGVNCLLNELDYTMFTTDDITVAYRELDAVSHRNRGINILAAGFRKTAPAAEKSKAFC
jgi:hypothetical protein